MWSSDDDLRNEMVYMAMRRNRFEDIIRNLHFEPKLRAPNGNDDKLWKLRPMTDHLKANMLGHFHPVQNLSYDESMISYYGRHPCKQFLKGKPIRFGYKVWSLCTPEGYLLNFEIYQGKNPRAKTQYEERFGKCTAPLINMLDELPVEVKDLPYSLFFDNLFTGFPLLAYLKLRGYNGTGTIRENRIPTSCPLPRKIILAKKARGHFESTKMTGTDIRLTKFVDSAVVCMASSCFGIEPKTTASRFSKETGKIVNFKRPYVVSEYNQNMAGVDRLDQNVAKYRIAYRGRKWWMSIFTWLIDVCVQNAWLLQRKHQPDLGQFEFRREIAIYYCKHFGKFPVGRGHSATEKCRTDKNTLVTMLRFDDKGHYVIPLDKKRRCAGDTCKSIVRTACQKCDVGLCLPCFKPYHTKQE